MYTLRQQWVFGLISLVFFNSLAIYNVSETTCGQPFIPILLSRALTTDPWRGITLGYSLIAIAASFTLNSSILTTAFFGFFSAFVVSMFETPVSHDFLIGTSSLLVMYECFPPTWKVDLRTIHYIVILVFGTVFFIWLFYINFSNDYTKYDEHCSWMFVTEYITFWSMNALILWVIPCNTYARDAISSECQEITASHRRVAQQQVKTKLLEVKTKLLDF
jgi:hypothetical protein